MEEPKLEGYPNGQQPATQKQRAEAFLNSSHRCTIWIGFRSPGMCNAFAKQEFVDQSLSEFERLSETLDGADYLIIPADRCFHGLVEFRIEKGCAPMRGLTAHSVARSLLYDIHGEIKQPSSDESLPKRISFGDKLDWTEFEKLRAYMKRERILLAADCAIDLMASSFDDTDDGTVAGIDQDQLARVRDAVCKLGTTKRDTVAKHLTCCVSNAFRSRLNLMHALAVRNLTLHLRDNGRLARHDEMLPLIRYTCLVARVCW